MEHVMKGSPERGPPGVPLSLSQRHLVAGITTPCGISAGDKGRLIDPHNSARKSLAMPLSLFLSNFNVFERSMPERS